jgi:hypothetical protein
MRKRFLGGDYRSRVSSMALEQNSKEDLVRANQMKLFGVLRAAIQCFFGVPLWLL